MSRLIRPTTTTDMHLPWVDYSTLTAVNMCPRWGIINSYIGKKFKEPGRAMALEAGSAMHDMFAAVRMFELCEHAFDKHQSNIPQFIYDHGSKLFNNEQYPTRWEEMMQIFDESDDYNTRMMRFALYALETSGFMDDPNDRKRTQTNLETCTISYVDRYPKRRYIPMCDEATNFVGVEIGVDVVLPTDPPVRFVGKVDGVCHDLLAENRLEVHENKTGARIDQSWAAGFQIGAQPTGYNAALSAMLGIPILRSVIWGTQVPIPKTSMYSDGQARIPAARDAEQFDEWITWVQYTWDVIRRYESDPASAVMHTHSCNRYFSTCPLLPLCSDTLEQRRHVIEHEMITHRWSPLVEE